MSATASAKFSSLSKELRDMIWSEAAAIQFQQKFLYLPFKHFLTRTYIAEGLLQSSSSRNPNPNPRAERRRQAFLGYDNLPAAERKPLRLHVRSSADKQKLRVIEDEFWALVSCLPMGTISYEARSHAADLCRKKVKVMEIFYFIDAPGDEDREILDHVFAQPSTVIVKKSRFKAPEFANFGSSKPGFDFESPEHLVDVVSRVFGSCVERIILNFWTDTTDGLDKVYWPHNVQTMNSRKGARDPKYIDNHKIDPDTVLMAPNRKMHATKHIWVDDEFNMKDAFWHLLKLYEILDVVKAGGRLPQLQGIDLELHTFCWGEDLLTQIRSTFKENVIWVNWSDVAIGYSHKFVTPTYS